MGILPTKLSSASGQPPIPKIEPSNLLHPALYAACIFSLKFEALECKCAPNSTSGNSFINLVNNQLITFVLLVPIVSLSYKILIPNSFNNFSAQ